MTATKTRKKQQTELIKKALQAQDDKKREERENFLITTIPITVQAAYEPSPVGDDHDEGTYLFYQNVFIVSNVFFFFSIQVTWEMRIQVRQSREIHRITASRLSHCFPHRYVQRSFKLSIFWMIQQYLKMEMPYMKWHIK